MKKIVYIVFSLCSLALTGSVLLAQHVNLVIGFAGIGLALYFGVSALESCDITLKETKETENTYIDEV